MAGGLKTVTVLVALALAVARADEYTWNKGRVNFQDAIWGDGPTPTEPSRVNILDLSSDIPYTAVVDPIAFSASRIILADSARLVFADDGQGNSARIILDDDPLNVNTTIAVPDPTDQDYDFNCAANWKRGQVTATYPPCVDDTVALSSDTGYFFWTSDDVSSVVLSGITVDSANVGINSLPENVFSTSLADRLHLGGSSDIDQCQFKTTTGCICVNTCPTDEQALQQNIDIVEGVQAYAESIKDALDTVRSTGVNVVYSIDSSALGFPMSLSNPTGLSDFMEHLGGPGFRQTPSASNPSPSSISISGSVMAARRWFVKPSANPTTTVSSYTTSITAASPFGVLDQAPIDPLITGALIMTSANNKIVSLPDCSGATTTCEALGLLGILAPDLNEALSALCPDNTCVGAGYNPTTFSNVAMLFPHGRRAQLLQHVKNTLEGNTLLGSLLTAVRAQSDDIAIITGAPPPVRSFTASFNFGSELPSFAPYRLADSRNKDDLLQEMLGQLEGTFPFLDIDTEAAALTLVPTTQPARRRRDTFSGDNELQLTFGYSAPCTTPTACAVNFNNPGSSGAQGFAALLAVAYQAHEIAFERCFDRTTSRWAWDQMCLANLIAQQYASTDATQSQVIDVAKTYVKCDLAGTANDGSCNEGEAADYESLATLVGEAAYLLIEESRSGNDNDDASGGSTGQSSGSSSNSSNLGIIVGAVVAGVVLITLLAFVIVRRRRKPALNVKQDRSAVAFENPMYDNQQGPTYDNQEGVEGEYGQVQDEDGGMYHEPAFAAQGGIKKNPMYDSSERLADNDGYITAEGAYMNPDGSVLTGKNHAVDGFDNDMTEGGYLDVGGDDFAGDDFAGDEEFDGGFGDENQFDE